MTALNAEPPGDDQLAIKMRRLEVCARFEEAWRGGRQPSIEAACLEVPSTERAGLLLELVAIEIELRLHAGGQATPQEYEDRFPDLAGCIPRLFEEARVAPSPAPPSKPGDVEAKLRPKLSTSYNLLFGLLALQNNFIDREGLLAAFNVWVADKSRGIGEILVDRGLLKPDRLALLEPLVRDHLEQHSDDPERSLAALSSIGSLRDDLEHLNDSGLTASVGQVSAARVSVDGPGDTASWTGGSTLRGNRFRVLRPFPSRGNLGELFVAHDLELHRDVILKQIREPQVDNDDSRSRFVMEGEVTGRLEHPGIVPVYGLGQYENGRPFYTMRWIQGTSLKDAIEAFHKPGNGGGKGSERTLAFRKILRHFVSVCETIAYAHSRGVLHRDIKPANVMIGAYGETIVIDWGLAKPVGHHFETATPRPEGTLLPSSSSGTPETQAGSVLGTPQFMSPEQSHGHLDQLGPASDVYSLGATLYVLLTGNPPFRGSPMEVLAKVQRGDFPSPRRVKADVPRALEAVCLKAMSLRPEERYRSAELLASDVEHWMADEPVTAWREPARERWARWARRHKPLVTGILISSLTVPTFLAVLLTVWARWDAAQREKLAEVYLHLVEPPQEANRKPGWTWQRLDDLRRAAALDVPQRSPARLRSEVADCLATVDVRQVGPGLLSLLVLDPVPGSGDKIDASCVAFSPDGRFLAVGQNKTTVPFPFQVRVVDLEGGSVRSFAIPPPLSIRDRNEGARTLAFSPRGEALVVGTRYGWIHHLDLTGPQPRPKSWKAHEGPVTGLAFDADARWLFSGSEDRTVKRWPLNAVRAEGVPAFDSIRFPGGVSDLRATADGRQVACVMYGWIVLVDGVTWKELSRRFPVKLDRLAVAPDGRTFAASVPAGEGTEGRRVVTLDLEHDEQVRGFQDPALPPGETHAAGHIDLEFSRDGSLLATAGQDDQDRSVKLWDVASGRLLVTLAATGSSALDACFSPDDRYLAVTDATGAALYQLGGVTAWTSLAHQAHPISAVGLGPAGRTLACAAEPRNPSGRACDPDVGLWDTSSGARMLRFPVARRTSSERCTDILLQGDGGRLVSSWTSGRILVTDAAGGGGVATINTDDPFALGLSPDGSRLWAASGSNVRSWLVGDGKETSNWSNAAAGVFSGRTGIDCLAIAPEWVIAGGADGTVKLLSGADGSRLLGTWRASDVPLRSVAYSPEKRLIAAGDLGGTVALFRPAGEMVARLEAHRESVETIQFSPDSQLMATGSRDRTIHLWTVAGGTVHDLLTLRAPAGPVHSISFSPDGQRLFVVVRGDLAVRVWHLDRLRQNLRPLGLDWK
jgi:serine/threonine protein kinase/WD40 repeat protein